VSANRPSTVDHHIARGYLLGSYIDANDLTARQAQRTPIGDPGMLCGLILLLPRNHLDAGDRLACFLD
jgi:hypothetical protein